MSSTATPRVAKGDAKNRLTDIRTEEVSLVDHAANLTTFVVRKRDERGPMDETVTKDAPADAPPPAAQPSPAADEPKALTMPQAAKDALLVGISAAVDALTQVGEAIKSANADDGAQVPAEVGQALGKIADMLEGIEAQYEGAPAGDAPPPPEQKSDAAPDLMKSSETAKAMPARLRKRCGAVLAELGGDVAKYGKPIATHRLAAIKQAASLLTSLVKEVEGAADDTPAAPPPVVAPPAQAPAPAAKADPPSAAPPVAPAMDPAVKKALDGITSELKTAVARIGEMVEARKQDAALVAKVNAALSSPTGPTSRPDDGVVRKAAPPPKAWPDDLSAEVELEKRATANGKKT